MQSIEGKIFLYLIVIFSAVFHEYAHAWSAYRLGDATAKDEGRLTLNPVKHIDPVGTILIPLILLFSSGIFIGWAKPVPYNPYNLRDQKYGDLKVGIAGPLANFLIAIIFAILLRFFGGYALFFGIINEAFLSFISIVIYINIVLGLFNLIPIPPLDGSKILMNIFPASKQFIEQIGVFGIFLALFLSFYILSPVAQFVFRLIVGAGF